MKSSLNSNDKQDYPTKLNTKYKEQSIKNNNSSKSILNINENKHNDSIQIRTNLNVETNNNTLISKLNNSSSSKNNISQISKNKLISNNPYTKKGYEGEERKIQTDILIGGSKRLKKTLKVNNSFSSLTNNPNHISSLTDSKIFMSKKLVNKSQIVNNITGDN